MASVKLDGASVREASNVRRDAEGRYLIVGVTISRNDWGKRGVWYGASLYHAPPAKPGYPAEASSVEGRWHSEAEVRAWLAKHTVKG